MLSMKRSALARILPVACWILPSVPALSQTLSDTQVASRVEAYLKPFGETGNLIGTVLVARGGRILFEQSYGMANEERKVPNSSKTRYRIASVSKPFTATAVLQLQERGRVSVSDPVSRFLPDFPNGKRITLDNLLAHTSGIPDINDLPDYDTWARSPHDLRQIVARFAGLPLEFQPGAETRYSNSNYALLALIVEKVSGESYGSYLRQHVFGPAGMRDGGADEERSRPIPSLAFSYTPAGIAGYDKAPQLDWSNKTGSGSLYATADDLYRFDRALKTDTLLESATRQKYFVEGPDNYYGWYIFQRAGHPIMAAKGHGPGVTAELDRFPDDDVTIILLSNSYGTVSQSPIAGDLAAIVFGKEVPAPALQTVKIPESVLASYAGEYQFGADYSFSPNAKFKLSARGGFLVMEIEDRHSPVVPLSKTDFLERDFFGRIAMVVDADGKVTGLTCRYGSRTFAARRLESS